MRQHPPSVSSDLPDDVARARLLAVARFSLVTGVALAVVTGGLGALVAMSTPETSASRVALWLPIFGPLCAFIIVGAGIALLVKRPSSPTSALRVHTRVLDCLWRATTVCLIAAATMLFVTSPQAWLQTVLGLIIALQAALGAFALTRFSARRLDPKPLGTRSPFPLA